MRRDFLRCDIEWSGRNAVVKIHGTLNRVSAQNLRGAVRRSIDAGAKLVVIDFTALESIDSSGMGALVGALRSARLADRDLRIAGLNPRVLHTFKHVGMDRVLRPFDDILSAIAAR